MIDNFQRVFRVHFAVKLHKKRAQLSPTYSKDQNDPNPPQNRLLGRGSGVAIEEELFHGARFCGLLYLDGRVDAHILLRATGGGLHEGLCGGGYDGDADGFSRQLLPRIFTYLPSVPSIQI
ncbi:hypothetical protein CEXT_128961 [Caerostris extrusa]|uniref:Uncharacterized protein n=1 Tax=Caerostris extrusa TaxID=172846 RepID=A0AAV4SP68_CAEEX|nr:hypothetical protein CEXT_128961 [Caerostris extrusa]